MRRAPRILLLAASLAGCDRALGIPDYIQDDTLSCADGVCACVSGKSNCDGTLANGCETSTVDDPSNCGDCFHSCLGGKCMGGQCVAGAPLITAPALVGTDACVEIDPKNPRRTVSDPVVRGGSLYLTYLDDCPNWRLARLPVTGSLSLPVLEPLDDGSSRATLASFILSPDGTKGYLLGKSLVFRLGLDPSAAATSLVPSLGATSTGDLALAGECLYVSVEGSTASTSKLLRLNLTTQTAEQIEPSIRALAGDGKRVIYAKHDPDGPDDLLYVVDASCGSPALLSGTRGTVLALTVDSVTGTAYVALRGSDGSVGGAPLYELTPSSNALDPTTPPLYVSSAVDGLAAMNGDVYWQSRSDFNIGRAAEPSDTSLLAKSAGMVSRLALDEQRIYWWTEDSKARIRSLVALARPPHK